MSEKNSHAIFWEFSSPDATNNRAWWADDEIETESIICPLDDGHQRSGEYRSDLSVLLTQEPVQDIVWTWYSDCLIQDHVLDAFRSAGLTGFEIKPVKARFRSKKKAHLTPPRLWELVVTGSAGLAPPESGVRVLEECSACGYVRYSKITDQSKRISPEQWDGTDFFHVKPSGYKFITDRVKKCIQTHKFRGSKFVRPEDIKNP